MKERIIIMKEVLRNKLLCLLLLCISNTYSQPSDREKLIDSLLDNTSIDFELKVNNKDYVLLEITNTTNDTLSVRISLPVDKDDYSLYIAGYKKNILIIKEKILFIINGALCLHVIHLDLMQECCYLRRKERSLGCYFQKRKYLLH